MALKKGERERLREMFGGRCAYCGCELPEKGWHADHVEPVWREWWKKRPKVKYTFDSVTGEPTRHEEKQVVGMLAPERDTVGNMFPSCAQCNLYKHSMSLEAFRQQVGRQIEMLRAYSSNFRTAERFGMVAAIEKPVVFHFETYVPPAASKSEDATAVAAARNMEKDSRKTN